MPVKIRHTETDRGSYCNKEDGQKYLDGEGTFFNGNESDDSDNEDENYNKNNEQQQLSQGFANNCDKIVSPVFLQELINDFCRLQVLQWYTTCSEAVAQRCIAKRIYRNFVKFTGKQLSL